MIGITQPRRVAVLATSKRVSYELGLKLGKEVGFQVRHDKKVGSKCSIKFMTDGILLREIQVVHLITCLCCFYLVYFSKSHVFSTQLTVYHENLLWKK